MCQGVILSTLDKPNTIKEDHLPVSMSVEALELEGTSPTQAQFIQLEQEDQDPM